MRPMILILSFRDGPNNTVVLKLQETVASSILQAKVKGGVFSGTTLDGISYAFDVADVLYVLMETVESWEAKRRAMQSQPMQQSSVSGVRAW